MSNTTAIKICKQCVMDTTDSKITFDAEGVCDHCRGFEAAVLPQWNYGKGREKELGDIVEKIKASGKGKEYDCILGMSGGADSSYMLHVAVKELKLRPLVFHVDGGWNSDIAVSNIHCMIEKLGLDLFTEVIDWENMKDFQLGYFKSGLSNIDIPQDHAFVATLYNFSLKHKIKYILNGGNISTECVRNPKEWVYYGTDMKQVNYIRKHFCDTTLDHYPFSSVLRHKFYLKFLRGVQVVKLLDLVEYNKPSAMKFLEEEYGWRPYPRKHFESRFTRFYEGYWLPKRFGYDTRKVQYSSLILTNQMTREEALELLKKPEMTEEEAQQDMRYIASKLDITVEQLLEYLNAPLKTYQDYPNQEKMFDIGAKILNKLGLEGTIKR